MDKFANIFMRKRVNFEKLEAFGFIRQKDIYTYCTVLSESGFSMTVTVSAEGKVSTVVMDPEFGEPYVLHLADGTVGSFVTGIRTEYKRILTEIADKCFDIDVFKTEQAKELISYVRDRYGDELEFLWQKFPDNAIWRRKDNEKWYAALLTVSQKKLGMKSDEIVEIIDLRLSPEKMESLIDKKNYFPGWHMNKKHWYTIILDGSVSTDEICQRLNDSYLLAASS